jgi:hypothetical protein
VVDYIGRYTHRVAISNHRIMGIENGQVSFNWRDYRDPEIQEWLGHSNVSTTGLSRSALGPGKREQDAYGLALGGVATSLRYSLYGLRGKRSATPQLIPSLGLIRQDTRGSEPPVLFGLFPPGKGAEGRAFSPRITRQIARRTIL